MSARESLLKRANSVKERVANISSRANEIHHLSSSGANNNLGAGYGPGRDLLHPTTNRVTEATVDVTAKLLSRLERLNEVSTEVWKRTTTLADKKIVEDVMSKIARSIEELKTRLAGRMEWVNTTVNSKIKDFAKVSLVSKEIIPIRNAEIDSVAEVLKGAVTSLETRVMDMLTRGGVDLPRLVERVDAVRGFTGSFDGVYPRFASNLSVPLSNLQSRLDGLGGEAVLDRVESEETLADLDVRLNAIGI